MENLQAVVIAIFDLMQFTLLNKIKNLRVRLTSGKCVVVGQKLPATKTTVAEEFNLSLIRSKERSIGLSKILDIRLPE
jgi:hypothetical protein